MFFFFIYIAGRFNSLEALYEDKEFSEAIDMCKDAANQTAIKNY